MRGRGKTNSTKLRLQKVSPLFVVDIRNEFKHLPCFVTFQDFMYWVMSKETKYIKFPPVSFMEFYMDRQYRFAFTNQQEYEALFKTMNTFRNCMIVIDEADAIFTNRRFELPLTDVFLGSRNNNVSLILIGKRPFFIPPMIRSQADKFTIFAIEEEIDIRYLSRRVKQEFPKDVYKLERGEAIVFEQGEKPTIEKYEKFKGE